MPLQDQQYVDYAVEALHDYLSTGVNSFATHLAALMTRQGLTAADIPEPVAVLKFEAPFDPRSPLVHIFDASWTFGGGGAKQRHNIAAVDCIVAVTYLSAANVETGEVNARRYMTALANAIIADPTLCSTVTGTVLGDGGRDSFPFDSSSIRHTRFQRMTIRVQTP